MKKSYSAPKVSPLGSVGQLTNNNNQPRFVDVPEGTPLDQGPIIGDRIPSVS
jgi:hypothetical protein